MDQKHIPLVEVKLKKPDFFNVIVETLTRIGIRGRSESGKPALFQTCHILHKQGKYYIVHFKQMYALDGRYSSFDREDHARLNYIVKLLQSWSLIDVVKPEQVETPKPEMFGLYVIKYEDKSKWTLLPKYTIGLKGKSSKFNKNKKIVGDT